MLLWLLACTSLDTTGADGLVGRIIDHQHEPVADLSLIHI